MNAPRPSLNPRQRQQWRNLLATSTATVLIAAIGIGLWKQDKQVPLAPETVIAEYYFQPSTDNLYENPDNWHPEYPGAVISSGQKVVLQGMAILPFYDLEVNGILHISVGSTLHAPKQKLRVSQTGKLINDGEALLSSLHNEGQLNNNFTGKISCDFFSNLTSGEMFNLQGSELTVTQRLLNTGNFFNYGTCNAEATFENRSTFNQLGSAELIVNGESLQIAVNQTAQ